MTTDIIAGAATALYQPRKRRRRRMPSKDMMRMLHLESDGTESTK